MFAGYEGIEYFVEDQVKNVKSELLTEYIIDRSFELDKNNVFSSTDLLILIEGSELDGPIPKLILPENSNIDFDMDEFAVCLMSVDMQKMAGLTFNLNAEAQLIMTISSKNQYAFVHYFTLYDIMARGFVRPFCLAYLSKEFNKLIKLHDSLSSQMNKITFDLKLKNSLVFFKDILQTLCDIQYTKECYIRYMRGNVAFLQSEMIIFEKLNITEFNLAIEEMLKLLNPLSEMLSQYQDIMEDEFTQDALEQINKGVNFLEICKDYKPKLKANLITRLQKSLKSIKELCASSNYYNTLYLLHKFFNRDFLEIENENSSIKPSEGNLVIGGKVIMQFFKRSVMEFNSDLSQLVSHELKLSQPKALQSVGSGILQFVRNYSFSNSLFYSLLIGRTTFVIGSNYNKVLNILNTLSLFLPGDPRTIILNEIPVDRVQLKTTKLVGINLSSSVKVNQIFNENIKDDIAIFNIDQKSFSAPKYKGEYINPITDSKRCFESDDSYIAFIQVILHEIAMKAFIYYHSFVQHPDNCTNLICKHSLSSQDFLKSISVNTEDSVIIQHWVQLVFEGTIDSYSSSDISVLLDS